MSRLPKFLYHMTLAENINRIAKYGLYPRSEVYSHSELADQSVVDRRDNFKEPLHGNSLSSYVPFYFSPRNPMPFRRKEKQAEIVILKISSEVLNWANKTIFTDGNAASSGTSFYKGGSYNLKNLSKLDWDCLHSDFWNNFEDGKRKKCAEVLVEGRLYPSKIQELLSVLML